MASGWWKELSCAIVIIGLLAATPPEVVGAVSPSQWAILVYVQSTGDLESLGDSYQQYLQEAALSEQVVVAAEIVERAGGQNDTIRARRWLSDGSGQCVSHVVEPSGTSRVARLANLIKWGIDKTVAQHYALVVAGHGQVAPLLTDPEGAADTAIAQEDRIALSAGDLSEALEQGLAGSGVRKLDVVFLDCCFGATFEVGSQLKQVADYLVGTPGLMYSPGLPWDKILSWLAAHPRASGRLLARRAVESLENTWKDEPELPVSVLAVDLSAIDAVGEWLDTLATAMIAHMPAIIPEITLARSRAESWGPHSELVDLGGLMVAMSSSSDCGAVVQQAHQVERAVERAVVASYLQGSLGPTRLRHLGLAVFFPLGLDWWPDIYHRCSAGEQWMGWKSVLRCYLHALHSSTVEQASTGITGYGYTAR
jgi:hypothetical protein